jgi:hypothetical protein
MEELFRARAAIDQPVKALINLLFSSECNNQYFLEKSRRLPKSQLKLRRRKFQMNTCHLTKTVNSQKNQRTHVRNNTPLRKTVIKLAILTIVTTEFP